MLKGQFWLKSDMDTLGQFGPIVVKPGYQITGTFTHNKIKSLDKSSRHCISDNKYSYNKCLRKYASHFSGCDIDISKEKFICDKTGGLKLLFDTLVQLKTSTRRDIGEDTGCLPKCVTHKYSFELKETEEVEWRTDWISAFYLSSETTTYENSIESYSYDEQVGIVAAYCFEPQDLL